MVIPASNDDGAIDGFSRCAAAFISIEPRILDSCRGSECRFGQIIYLPTNLYSRQAVVDGSSTKKITVVV